MHGSGLVLACAATALLVAGCVGQSQVVPARLIVPPLLPSLLPPAFLPDLALSQKGSAGEPSLAVLPDGTLFVTAPPGACQTSPSLQQTMAWLWRSKDHGATWEVLRQPADDGKPQATRCSYDADVATSSDGWVYASDWWSTGAVIVPNNFLVERSSDGGQTWASTIITTPRLASTYTPFAGAGIDRQWLLAGADGLVGVFYDVTVYPAVALNPLAPGSRTIEAVFSHDHGAHWDLPLTVVAAQPDREALIAKPFLLPDGSIVLPFAEEIFKEGGGDVRASISRDAGKTWKVQNVANFGVSFDNIWPVQGAADATGNIFVAWATIQAGGTGYGISLSRSEDGGATWSEPESVVQHGTNVMPWVAARGNGTVAVAWYGGDYRGTLSAAPSDATWMARIALSRDGGRTFAVGNLSAEPVKKGPFCVGGSNCNGNRELLDFLNIAYSSDGQMHAVFARSLPEGKAARAVIHYASLPPSADGA